VQSPAEAYSRTVVAADDHPAMLAAVVEVLERNGFDVLATAGDGRAAVDALERTRPRVALLDVQMPHLSGIEVARAVAPALPDTVFVFYTAFGDRALLADALDAGALGFVLKEAPLHDLVRAVERVAAGHAYVDPVLAGVLVGAPATVQVRTLTQRERDVLRLLADGRANEGIASELGISAETVRTHIRKAMDKLDADTRTHAVAMALRQSLIS
jgi:DNA-binding NarL/FixJ family response regulator